MDQDGEEIFNSATLIGSYSELEWGRNFQRYFS